jgi:hypothetical protein
LSCAREDFQLPRRFGAERATLQQADEIFLQGNSSGDPRVSFADGDGGEAAGETGLYQPHLHSKQITELNSQPSLSYRKRISVLARVGLRHSPATGRSIVLKEVSDYLWLGIMVSSTQI